MVPSRYANSQPGNMDTAPLRKLMREAMRGKSGVMSEMGTDSLEEAGAEAGDGVADSSDVDVGGPNTVGHPFGQGTKPFQWVVVRQLGDAAYRVSGHHRRKSGLLTSSTDRTAHATRHSMMDGARCLRSMMGLTVHLV